MIAAVHVDVGPGTKVGVEAVRILISAIGAVSLGLGPVLAEPPMNERELEQQFGRVFSSLIDYGVCDIIGTALQGEPKTMGPLPSDLIPGPLRLEHRPNDKNSVLVERQFAPDYIWRVDPGEFLTTSQFANFSPDGKELLRFDVLAYDPPDEAGEWRLVKRYVSEEPAIGDGKFDFLQIMDYTGGTWGKAYYYRMEGSSAPRRLFSEFRCIPVSP